MTMRLRPLAVTLAALVALTVGCDDAALTRRPGGAPRVGSTPATSTEVSMRTFGMTRDGVTLTVPYCGNRALEAATTIRRVVVVVHGSSRNACDYAGYAVESARRHGVLHETLVIAPRFQTDDDLRSGSGNALYWSSGGWKSGESSLSSPHPRPWAASSFTVVDEMVTRARGVLPAVSEVVVAGHSAGGQFTNRYAAATGVHGVTSFVVANPSSYLYVDDRRWHGDDLRALSPAESDACSEFDDYKYGLDDLEPYPAAVGADLLRLQLASRRVVYLLGGADTSTTDSSLDTNCAAGWQGRHRLERGMRYVRHLAAVYGPSVAERHVQSVVPSVGHQGRAMLTSAEGRTALFGPG
jgi:pimeloyl-ACP methyl ester carboxylesterase